MSSKTQAFLGELVLLCRKYDAEIGGVRGLDGYVLAVDCKQFYEMHVDSYSAYVLNHDEGETEVDGDGELLR